MRAANIGGPIALAVIGAVLYFALGNRVEGVDLPMIGLILMVAAAVWLVLGLIVNRPRPVVTTERTDIAGSGGAPQGGYGGPEQQHVEREVRHDGF